jgi:hypothetical protein
MSGGVGGVWRGNSRHPYPDNRSIAQLRATAVPCDNDLGRTHAIAYYLRCLSEAEPTQIALDSLDSERSERGRPRDRQGLRGGDRW